MKKLLLEGDSGSGKTTIILKELGDRIKVAGGFSTVRLLYEDGSCAGYCVKHAREMTSVEEKLRDDTDHIFISFTDKGRFKDESVFTAFAEKSLQGSDDSLFLLMDEFGGVELGDDSFMKILREAFTSTKPVIGVIKSRKNAEHLSERLGMGESYMAAYDSFRHYILSETDSVILPVDRTSREEAAEVVRSWVSENLGE